MTSQSPPDARASDDYSRAWASVQHVVMNEGASWSGREKNVAYLNLGGGRFANVSACTSADYADDSRAVASVDWDDDGRLDLVLKGRTGPRLRILRNQSRSPGHFLAVELAGRGCNRDAIGARVTVELEGRTLRKTLHAGDGYLSQSSKRLHFGLGGAPRVARLEVRWPDGSTDSFENLPGDSRYRIVQGSTALVVLAPRPAPELAQSVETLEGDRRRVGRTVLADKLPMAAVALPAFDRPGRRVADLAGSPVLVNLWASWCASCRVELADFGRERARIDRSGLRIVTVTADEAPDLAKARRLLEPVGLQAGAGYLDGRLKQTLEVLMYEVFGRAADVALPTSLLLDEAGQLVAVYQGPVELERLLADVELLGGMEVREGSCADLAGGRWLDRPERDLETLARVFANLGDGELGRFYGELAERRSQRAAMVGARADGE